MIPEKVACQVSSRIVFCRYDSVRSAHWYRLPSLLWASYPLLLSAHRFHLPSLSKTVEMQAGFVASHSMITDISQYDYSYTVSFRRSIDGARHPSTIRKTSKGRLFITLSDYPPIDIYQVFSSPHRLLQLYYIIIILFVNTYFGYYASTIYGTNNLHFCFLFRSFLLYFCNYLLSIVSICYFYVTLFLDHFSFFNWLLLYIIRYLI